MALSLHQVLDSPHPTHLKDQAQALQQYARDTTAYGVRHQHREHQQAIVEEVVSAPGSFPSTSLVRRSPLEHVHLWAALEQVLLCCFGCFLCHLGLLCCDGLGLNELFYRERGIACLV